MNTYVRPVNRWILWAAVLFISAACRPPSPPPTTTPVAPPAAQETARSLADLVDLQNPLQDVVIATPTPAPTATPSFVEHMVEDVTISTGLDDVEFLGLWMADWINLLISLLYIVVAIFILVPLTFYLLRRLAKKTDMPYGEAVLNTIEWQVKWFVGVLIIQYAVNRLGFLPPTVKQWVNQQCYTVYVILITVAVWRVINRGLTLYQQRRSSQAAQAGTKVLLPIVRRLAQLVLLIIAATLVLNNYGVSVTLPVVVLGLIGFALSIAARDTLTDVFDGLIILLDQPFRVGDRIEIQELGRWGDVVEIGPRTTRIRTRDNMLVIVPNSKIGRSQVVNYTYPDTRYRMETRIGIAYGSDIEAARQLMIETIRNVDGVLTERAVNALLDEFGDSALIFRVRWWSHTYSDMRYVRDRVHTALYKALTEAGIELPFATYDVNIKLTNPLKQIASNQHETE